MRGNESKGSTRSSLLLVELILSILFFCLCSAVCVRIFVKSHLISQDTGNLTMAVNQASSFTELFREEDDFLSYLTESYTDGALSSDKSTFSLYYADDWTICSSDDAAFVLEIQLKEDSEDNALLSGTFSMKNVTSDTEIYEIETKKYIAREDLR